MTSVPATPRMHTSGVKFVIDLTNPVVIGILIALLILFFPFAIFIVDLFSYEHE